MNVIWIILKSLYVISEMDIVSIHLVLIGAFAMMDSSSILVLICIFVKVGIIISFYSVKNVIQTVECNLFF